MKEDQSAQSNLILSEISRRTGIRGHSSYSKNEFWDREQVAGEEWDQIFKNCYQTADGLAT